MPWTRELDCGSVLSPDPIVAITDGRARAGIDLLEARGSSGKFSHCTPELSTAAVLLVGK
jgi:hypothetical protein